MKVLLVEDEATTRRLLREMLGNLGYTVVSAETGEEGVHYFAEGHFDLVLMDVHLPGISGVDAAIAIRKAKLDDEVPIIAVTGDRSFREEQGKFLQLGFDEFIAKPATLESLRTTIQRVTRNRCDVLFIEDSENDFELAKQSLRSANHALLEIGEIERAATLTEAVEVLRTDKYNVVILDYGLPDTEGLRALETVKKEFPNLPVILLTALDDTSIAISALHYGAQDYLVKGSSGAELVRSVRYALERNFNQIALRRAEERANIANEAKSSFLANMSHEIRTPLTAILGFADVALNEAVSDRQKTSLQSVMRNGDHLLQVINDILDLSKIEAGRLETNQEDVELFGLMEGLESIFRPRAVEKGIAFGVEYRFPLPKIFPSDTLHVRQVLFNLIGNALKFTESGGVKVVISFEEEGQELKFRVIDTGIGMTREEVSHVFQPFTQADSSTTRNFGGTGLGLPISQKLAVALGGSIRVRSEKGMGSEFLFLLYPGELAEDVFVEQAPEVSVARDQPSRREVPDLGGRVLVVDDMPDNRALLRYYLERAGSEVVVACNGKEALRHAEQSNFDLILLDMHMPVMDGYDCVAKLHEMGVKTPIVAITASAMNGAMHRCIEAGCDDYVRKPFKVGIFYATVAKFLQGSQRSLQNESENSDAQSALDAPSDVVDETLVSIVLGFLERLPSRLDTLRECCAQSDWEEVKQQAHRLSGSELFGFGDLGRAAHALELSVVSEQYEKIPELLALLEEKAALALETRDVLTSPGDG